MLMVVVVVVVDATLKRVTQTSKNLMKFTTTETIFKTANTMCLGPSLLWQFRQRRLIVGFLVTATNLRCVKSSQSDWPQHKKASLHLLHMCRITFSIPDLKTDPLFVASDLLSSLERTMIFLIAPSPTPTKTSVNKDPICTAQPSPYQQLTRFPPISQSQPLISVILSHHTGTI